MKTKIPQFENKKDLFEYLIQNKSLLIAEKKMSVKHSEGFSYSGTLFNEKDETVKANNDLNLNNDVNEIKADVKALMAQSNIDKTRIDNLERQVYKTTSSIPMLPSKEKQVMINQYAVLPDNKLKIIKYVL